MNFSDDRHQELVNLATPGRRFQTNGKIPLVVASAGCPNLKSICPMLHDFGWCREESIRDMRVAQVQLKSHLSQHVRYLTGTVQYCNEVSV